MKHKKEAKEMMHKMVEKKMPEMKAKVKKKMHKASRGK